ncbi:hypothetical protein MRX62_13810 (plasmid) [Xylella fastidiosa subsp. pauca]
MCVDVALGFSDFPNIHRIGLPANPRLKSNSSNKSFRAFTCDRGGRLQKSGKVGLDDRPPQMDKRVRKEAPHSEVKKCLSHAASETPISAKPIGIGLSQPAGRIGVSSNQITTGDRHERKIKRFIYSETIHCNTRIEAQQVARTHFNTRIDAWPTDERVVCDREFCRALIETHPHPDALKAAFQKQLLASKLKQQDDAFSDRLNPEAIHQMQNQIAEVREKWIAFSHNRLQHQVHLKRTDWWVRPHWFPL